MKSRIRGCTFCPLMYYASQTHDNFIRFWSLKIDPLQPCSSVAFWRQEPNKLSIHLHPTFELRIHPGPVPQLLVLSLLKDIGNAFH